MLLDFIDRINKSNIVLKTIDISNPFKRIIVKCDNKHYFTIIPISLLFRKIKCPICIKIESNSYLFELKSNYKSEFPLKYLIITSKRVEELMSLFRFYFREIAFDKDVKFLQEIMEKIMTVFFKYFNNEDYTLHEIEFIISYFFSVICDLFYRVPYRKSIVNFGINIKDSFVRSMLNKNIKIINSIFGIESIYDYRYFGELSNEIDVSDWIIRAYQINSKIDNIPHIFFDKEEEEINEIFDEIPEIETQENIAEENIIQTDKYALYIFDVNNLVNSLRSKHKKRGANTLRLVSPFNRIKKLFDGEPYEAYFFLSKHLNYVKKEFTIEDYHYWFVEEYYKDYTNNQFVDPDATLTGITVHQIEINHDKISHIYFGSGDKDLHIVLDTARKYKIPITTIVVELENLSKEIGMLSDNLEILYK